jgi:hypothetical protein
MNHPNDLKVLGKYLVNDDFSILGLLSTKSIGTYQSLRFRRSADAWCNNSAQLPGMGNGLRVLENI